VSNRSETIRERTEKMKSGHKSPEAVFSELAVGISDSDEAVRIQHKTVCLRFRPCFASS